MAREAGTSVAAHPYAVWTEPPVAESRPASGRSDPGAVALPGAVAAEHPRTEYPPVDAAVWQDEALRCLLRSPALLGPRVYRIAVCITLYNESAHEIEATLESLNSCVTCLRNATRRQSMMSLFEVVVVLIQDGWEHPTSREPIVHPTTRDLFTLNGTVPDVWTTSASQSRLSAVVGQRCVDTDAGAGASRSAGACWAKRYPNLDMALIVSKGPNRRKYNSHGWFYAACDGLLKPDFVFLTDAGTTYKRDCLRKLVEVLRDNQDVVGATARQRAMTPGSMPGYDSSCGSWVRWFFSPASAQSFEFEAGFILNIALFTIVGMLPVLPGPCQLIRWNASTKGAFKEYLDIVQPKLTDGFIKALLRLAEDRVLSALVVLRSGRRAVWVPGATFYYPPEMSLASLVAQRRRWNNGTLAANVYLVTDPDSAVSDGEVPGGRATTGMWYFQLYQAAAVALAPAVFADALQASVLNLEHHDFAGGFLSKLRYTADVGAPEMAAGAFFAIYLMWMLTSHCFKLTRSLCSKLWQYFVYTISVATMLIIMYSMVWVSLANGRVGIIEVLVVATLIIPPLAAVAQSMRAAVLYLLYLPLSLPSVCFYLCFMTSYGTARLSELSWGTKNTGSEAVGRRQLASYTRKARAVLCGVALVNSLLFVAFVLTNDRGDLTTSIQAIAYVLLLAPIAINFVCAFLFFLKRTAEGVYATCKRDSELTARLNRRPLSREASLLPSWARESATTAASA